ncbi:hypothetical protein CASFOL_017219 [Castilleja foliolosa]|uniref:NAC domain-containing protein n=1 Tax=Castilleja foliolosa TaxID=1961234 RepID=A0ABD3DBF0_9LAMI
MEEINLPPGFRFHPTDEELITYYLSNKASDFEFTARAVVDVDLNKCEPWDLPAKASMGEKEWYFFSLKDRKYPTGLRTNRATEAGYWKTTGKDKEIFRANVLVGMKKTLVFYRGRAPKGAKTNWVMHEYRLENKPVFKEEWVVCRVFEKSSPVNKKQTSSPQISQDLTIGDDDVDIPNFTNNINIIDDNIDNNNNNINIAHQLQHYNNLMMNLPANYSEQPLLNNTNNNNISINSLLLTALQLRGHHLHHNQTATSSANNNNNNNTINYSNFMNMPEAGDQNDYFDMNMAGSTSRPVLEPPGPDQPFDLDSNIWG